MGSGAYKAVYKAIDSDTGCEVAWNVLKTCGMSKAEKERVRDEIMLIQKLTHPNIIHFIKAWHNREKEEVVFITEIMTGGSLKQYLKRIKNPHLRVIKQWCRGILEGLQYLHSQKPYPIIHRDLKCDNIFVSSSTGDVRIGDLGLSTFMKNSHNKTILGTPQYMAPELYEERYGPSVDIYSFGLCVLEMCTHTTPYAECKNPLEIYNRVISGKKPLALDRILDEEVKEFIELCLTPVDQRPHAEELLNHKFLVIKENDEKVHLPVMVKSEDENHLNSHRNDKEQDTPTIMEVNSKALEYLDEVKIELKIGFRDPMMRKIIPTKIDFIFNTTTDTPEGVSDEIINTFTVDPCYSQILSQIIREKVFESLKNADTNYKSKPKSLFQADHEENKYFDEVSIPPFKDIIFKNNPDNSKTEVMLLQRCLAHITGDRILIDGNFTIRTENTVKKFQESQGLPADGIVKKQTWEQIMIQDAKKNKQEIIRKFKKINN